MTGNSILQSAVCLMDTTPVSKLKILLALRLRFGISELSRCQSILFLKISGGGVSSRGGNGRGGYRGSGERRKCLFQLP